jgi:hypothetical protein
MCFMSCATGFTEHTNKHLCLLELSTMFVVLNRYTNLSFRFNFGSTFTSLITLKFKRKSKGSYEANG